MMPAAEPPEMRAIAVRRARIGEFDPEKPPAEYGLTERGCVQSRLLGARLARDGGVDAVYTGDSDRHRETADLVVGTVEAITDDRPPVDTESGLDDIAWTADALAECAEAGHTQAEWIDRWADGGLPIEESVAEARERLADLATRLADRHDPDDTVLLVTSTVPVGVLACDAMGTDFAATELTVANAALSSFEWRDDGRSLGAFNDTSHLPGELVTVDGFVERG